MRHVVVRRTALTLAAALAACAVVFVRLVAPRMPALPAHPQSTEGSALFQAHCASCHELSALRERVAVARTGRAALEALLTHHGDASVDEARLILDVVLERTAAPRRE